MNKLLLILTLLLFPIAVYAGGVHQDDSTHTIIYTVTDLSGNHVTGETVRLTVKSSDTVNYLDFNDGSWGGFTTNTTKHATMNEDANGGFYFYTITMDTAITHSGDIIFIVSNDSATYADLQAESINFDNIINKIKIHR